MSAPKPVEWAFLLVLLALGVYAASGPPPQPTFDGLLFALYGLGAVVSGLRAWRRQENRTVNALLCFIFLIQALARLSAVLSGALL